MAFPLPPHLPRKRPQDVSSTLLSTISEASSKSLNATLVASWIVELNENIQVSKNSIHERISHDQDSFQKQLDSAKSVQTRLHSLETSVDGLSNVLLNPERGLAPNLIRILSEHSSLAQAALDAQITHQNLSHILQCRDAFNSLSRLVSDGDLPQAVKLSEDLAGLLKDPPSPLGEAEAIKGLNRQYRAMRDRAEEQLSEAYTRGVIITPSILVVRPAIQVRQSSKVLSFTSILSSLSAASLTEHLTTLRRDLTTHYIDYVLTQPLSVTRTSTVDASGTPEERLQLFPAASNPDVPISRIDNLAIILTFLDTHLFSALPESQRSTFLKSLSKSLTSGILNHILVPYLPSALSSLPPYLELISRAIRFEEQDLSKLFGGATDEEIKSWTNGVVVHYEKKRRIDILDRCRQALMRSGDDRNATFQAEASPPKPAVQKGEKNGAWSFDDTQGPTNNGAKYTTEDIIDVDEDGWGFEDENQVEAAPDVPADDIEEDAWGWNDNSSPVEDGPGDTGDEPAWDAWDDPPPVSNGRSPKPAKRLEKFSSKGKNVQQYDNPSGLPQTSKQIPSQAVSVPRKPPELGITEPEQPPAKEFYFVSLRMKEMTSMVEDILREAEEFSRSKFFLSFPSPATPPGTLIFQAASSILDLFRALYPVVYSSDMSKSPDRPMRLSNDCLYLSEEVGRSSKLFTVNRTVKDNLHECQEKLEIFGESLFQETIDKQVTEIDTILVPAQGFIDTGDQEQFDVCESAVNGVLQKIKHISRQWKRILTRTRHLTAVGSLVDAALSRVLEDITALPDITAVESHRLSELCRIWNALEGLFVEGPDQQSLVVAYVPCWLKFSYLSEMLEGSMADIAYLFEVGALIDFEVEELVKLVRALFADTPLRANTISKIQGGHPNS